MTDSDTGLKLLARDAAALEVVSAHAQDALLQVGDMAHEAAMRRFVLMLNRFRWEQGGKQRIRSALVIENVTAVQHKRIRLDKRDAALSLLALEFTADAAPSGDVRLVFSGGGEIRLAVEAVSTILEDIGQSWETPSRPHHELPE